MVAGKSVSLSVRTIFQYFTSLQSHRRNSLITFSVCWHHNRKPIDHFLQCMDELTLDDVTAFAKVLLSSQPTMASYGDGMLLDFPLGFK